MKVSLNLEIELNSEAEAKKVVQAVIIDVESSSDYFERSKLEIKSQKNKIILKIEAKDIIAAKSSVNTTLIWLENAIKIIEKYSN